MKSSGIVSGVIADLRTPPRWPDLTVAILATLLLAGVAWIFLPHFADLSKVPSPRQMAKIAFVAFFFPALFEELVFRGFLNSAQSPLSIALSTAAFILWHPLAAHLFLPEAKPYVTDPVFLVFVGIFGLLFCLLRKKTGSLWIPILSHWVLTLLWKGLGGAQFLT
ncbi:MAG: CPBP family glutamic-type intramembrane protease [Verrucomicrobiota bacterium]